MTDELVLLLVLAAVLSGSSSSAASSSPRKRPAVRSPGQPQQWPPGTDNLGVHPLPPNPLKRNR